MPTRSLPAAPRPREVAAASPTRRFPETPFYGLAAASHLGKYARAEGRRGARADHERCQEHGCGIWCRKMEARRSNHQGDEWLRLQPLYTVRQHRNQETEMPRRRPCENLVVRAREAVGRQPRCQALCQEEPAPPTRLQLRQTRLGGCGNIFGTTLFFSFLPTPSMPPNQETTKLLLFPVFSVARYIVRHRRYQPLLRWYLSGSGRAAAVPAPPAGTGHRAKDGRCSDEKDRIVSLNSLSFAKRRREKL
ncbi:hypothetical protein P4O66_006687 [Electrophorus voltai]|uniref:Uncharacterized protein n=1 Tax=Electrophorus voltai TaxID=2609070 RepID=A0AAD8ZJ80_9TELE|nr:hypothetical protein P4O66_006687 [Electrophorus voltai]